MNIIKKIITTIQNHNDEYDKFHQRKGNVQASGPKTGRPKSPPPTE